MVTRDRLMTLLSPMILQLFTSALSMQSSGLDILTQR